MYAEGEEDIPELPEPNETGGWVYERAFLHFRSKAPKSVAPDKISQYYERHVGKRLGALEDILEPSVHDHLAFRDAMEVFTDYERYGFPISGGLNDQESQYIYVLNCIQTAKNNAEYLENQEEAYRNFAREQEAEQERQEQEALGGEVSLPAMS
jgi:hypothetical protein